MAASVQNFLYPQIPICSSIENLQNFRQSQLKSRRIQHECAKAKQVEKGDVPEIENLKWCTKIALFRIILNNFSLARHQFFTTVYSPAFSFIVITLFIISWPLSFSAWSLKWSPLMQWQSVWSIAFYLSQDISGKEDIIIVFLDEINIFHLKTIFSNFSQVQPSIL